VRHWLSSRWDQNWACPCWDLRRNFPACTCRGYVACRHILDVYHELGVVLMHPSRRCRGRVPSVLPMPYFASRRFANLLAIFSLQICRSTLQKGALYAPSRGSGAFFTSHCMCSPAWRIAFVFHFFLKASLAAASTSLCAFSASFWSFSAALLPYFFFASKFLSSASLLAFSFL
jgi:hypothetical protein